jgi:hypothetical protein
MYLDLKLNIVTLSRIPNLLPLCGVGIHKVFMECSGSTVALQVGEEFKTDTPVFSLQ